MCHFSAALHTTSVMSAHAIRAGGRENVERGLGTPEGTSGVEETPGA